MHIPKVLQEACKAQIWILNQPFGLEVYQMSGPQERNAIEQSIPAGAVRQMQLVWNQGPSGCVTYRTTQRKLALWILGEGLLN
ncbi:unnamed protein product [Rangifer tarandus platyrhynchus]|uniref:Uncharacterized protein n=1 Tax=Rangifer tarandus platyrhynchus TaxID=3082113 RepID=A0AC60A1W3_RANTA